MARTPDLTITRNSHVALIIIYNHQYNENIEILEQIYKDRFSIIYHLVPFYNGQKSNVIPVYDNSYYFQGYIAQGFKNFFKDTCSHYFFIADDLILNPIINENNYSEHLKLKEKTCFLPGFITLSDCKAWRVGQAFAYTLNIPGVEAKNQLPSYNNALEAFTRFGLKIEPLRFSQIWRNPDSIKDFGRIILHDKYYITRKLISWIGGKKYNLKYPFVGSYSDIFVISADAIKLFCHYCGVFAATKLFVEIALPTSIVLSAQEIVTENDLELQGEALWTNEQLKILDKYDYNLTSLLRDFPVSLLYLHPIKLSKWNKG